MSEPPCLFCQIVQGIIPAEIVYQDDRCTAFVDIDPQAPRHFLLIPNAHIRSIAEIESVDRELIGYLLERAAFIARTRGFVENGFRLVTNCGPQAGQSVYHLHFHLLSGRQFTWPPG